MIASVRVLLTLAVYLLAKEYGRPSIYWSKPDDNSA